MGGGKSGTVAAEAPKAMSTSTAIGSQLDAQAETFEMDDEEKGKNLEKKALGTRGLRIPRASAPTSNTAVSGPQI